MKEEKVRTNSLLEATRADLEKTLKNYSDAIKEIEQLKSAHQQQISDKSVEHAKELALEKDRWMKSLEETRKTNEADTKLTRSKYEEQVLCLGLITCRFVLYLINLLPCKPFMQRLSRVQRL